MRLLLSIAAALLTVTANAQQDFEYWPNADYDPSIPTIESVLGYAPGERITWQSDTRAVSVYMRENCDFPQTTPYELEPPIAQSVER